jgi:two-component system phosphate regulon response regulator OmpR
MSGHHHHHLVVVDDDLRDGVATYLRMQGYAVSEASGADALRAIVRERPVDLVVLDVNMPGEDGLSVARSPRQHGRVGIVMLTARTDTVDRIVGLEVGADDYLPKPFEARELLARVRAVLRRATTEALAPATLGREVRIGRCVLNLDSRKAYEAEGREVAITAMEFDLLKTFAAHPNRALSRDLLLDLAHSKEADVFDRSIDLRVARVRRKVEVDPEIPQAIKTVRGVGYMFVPRG